MGKPSLLILPGDGIGPEVMVEVRKVIEWFTTNRGLEFDVTEDLVGGAAYDAHGTPLHDDTMKKALDVDAVLLGAVGGPKWDDFGAGEFSILLEQKSNFKSSIIGKFVNEIDDRCDNYFYYARYLNVNMTNGETFYVGVATDYGGVYPDAPNIWKVDNNKEIELIFTSNIERYSINFELSQ